MDKAEPGGPRPYPPADFRRRAIARAIDLLIALAPIGLIPAGHPFAVALACIIVLEAGVALRPLTRDLGQRRLGDLIAGTQVIDGRVALGLETRPVTNPAPATAPLASRAAREEDPRACASR